MLRLAVGALLAVAVTLGCQPPSGARDAGGAGDGDGAVAPPLHGAITGRVWMPGQAPGQVPEGHEIPVSGAVVYASITLPAPIPAGAHCEPCVQPPFNAVQSDARGAFTVSVPPGGYWLVIQKGQFRREQRVEVGVDEAVALAAEATTLPAIHDPDAGAWVPTIALALGSWDKLEDLLGKLGLGAIGPGGRFTSTLGRFDVYLNGGQDPGLEARGTIAELVGDLDAMLAYHVILIPCSGDDYTALLADPAILHNLRAYVAAGGKLYVTDWSGEWSDNVFPAQIELGPSDLGAGARIDTPAAAYDEVAEVWDPASFGTADGDEYDSSNAQAADPDLAAWLDGQLGPNADGDVEIFDAEAFEIVDNWNYITGLVDVILGLTEKGLPIYDSPKAWVIGGQGVALPRRPLTVTYEPVGCGRVLFSTYHTTPSTHLGLVPQERVLLYLLMEIGVCKTTPIIE